MDIREQDLRTRQDELLQKQVEVLKQMDAVLERKDSSERELREIQDRINRVRQELQSLDEEGRKQEIERRIQSVEEQLSEKPHGRVGVTVTISEDQLGEREVIIRHPQRVGMSPGRDPSIVTRHFLLPTSRIGEEIMHSLVDDVPATTVNAPGIRNVNGALIQGSSKKLQEAALELEDIFWWNDGIEKAVKPTASVENVSVTANMLLLKDGTLELPLSFLQYEVQE